MKLNLLSEFRHKCWRMPTQTLLIMKITAILLFVACMQVSAIGYSQITLSENNVSLQKVLKQIQRQSDMDLLYNSELIQKAGKVTIDVRNVSVEKALDLCLREKQLMFSIDENTIIIKPIIEHKHIESTKEAVMQEIVIKGKVTDAAGVPIPGVTVLVKGTNKGTSTNGNGEFEIQVTSENKVLVFSGVGLKKQEVAITGQTIVNVVMEIEITKLSEITVVSTGYQVLPKERATGSFGIIQEKEIKNKISGNLIDKLEGMTSGLRIKVSQSDATLNTGRTSFSIRSQNTIQSNTQPLIVVDDFPTDFDLSYLNPEDIDQITVLKDAAATSIWGARAANGVIVIQTKKGKTNTPMHINVSSDLTITETPRLNYLPLMNSAEYINFEKEWIAKGKIPDPTNASSTTSTYPLSSGMEILFKQKNGLLTAEQANSMLDALGKIDFKEQYSRYLLQNPILQQYNISMGGGTTNSNTYLSGSIANEKPNAVGNKTDRITLKLAHTVKMLKRITYSSDMQMSTFTTKNNGLGLSPLTPGVTTLLPYSLIADENGNGIDFSREYYSGTLTRLESKGYLPWRYNYIDELANADNTSKNSLYRVNMALAADIINGLTAKISGSWEKQFIYNRNYYNENTYTSRNLINRHTSINSANKLVYGYPKGAILREEQINAENYNLRGQLDYNKTIHTKHQLTALAGMEMRETFAKGFSNTRYGYSDRDLTSLPVAYGTKVPQAVTGSQVTLADPSRNTWAQNRYLSYFVNAGYTFNKKYSFTASARLDDANLFGTSKKYRSTPLWSVGGLWNTSEEKWFTVSWIDLLKLRATYGVNGNVDFSTSPFLIATISSFLDPYIGQPYASISNPANPYLRWEKTRVINFASDFSLLKSRINGTIDLYFKKSYDLLGPAELNPTLGFSRATINTANMTGKGIDLTISAKIVDNLDWGWTSIVNYGYNTTKITKTDLEQNTVSYYINNGTSAPIVGQPVDRLFSYRYVGLDSKGQPMIYNEQGDTAKTTQTVLSKDALVYSGRTTPPHFGGWQNIVNYKNLSLSTLFTFQAGNVFRRPSMGDYSSYSTQKVLHKDGASRWRQAGDEATTMVPGIPIVGVSTAPSRYLNSDYLIEDAGYIRLREVVLSYELVPGQRMKKAFKSMQFNLQARNLFILTKNKQGIDPDYIPTSNLVVLPPARSFAFGVKIQF